MRLVGSMREKSARDGILDDVHGDIIFSDTVNAPNGAVFAINFQEGTTSVFEADGTTTPIRPVVVHYKARFTDGWLQWIWRFSEVESYREYSGEHW